MYLCSLFVTKSHALDPTNISENNLSQIKIVLWIADDCKKIWLLILFLLFCHNPQIFSWSEHIILPYHAKKNLCYFFLLHSPWTNSSLLYQCSGHMNKSTTTPLWNIVNNCNHVLKLVLACFMTFCFRLHTSELLSLFDSLLSLLSLVYELSISTYPHPPQAI